MSKMSKLDELNVFLSERLSAAVNEILDAVSRMMQEYEEETARTRRDNDYLKEMLKLTGWSFTEMNAGMFHGKQGMSDLQHESENCEGRFQNLELKEESTSIKIEQPDPRHAQHPEFEPPDKYPVPGLETGSPISEVWNVVKTRKGKSKLKLKKKHYCLYCKKPSMRMKQHLLSAHAKEPEVAKALIYDKNSKERKQLLDLLQSKGNLLHKDVGMSRTSSASSKWHTTARSNKDYVQCIYCLRLYSSKSIANHVKRCKHKYPCSHEAITSQTGAALSQELLTADQGSSPSSCRTKHKHSNPESVGTDVSKTFHVAAQLYTNAESTGSSTYKDSSWAGEHLLADLESQSDLTLDASLPRNDLMNKIPTCSAQPYNQTETTSGEDKKTDAEQSKENGHAVESGRRSSHVETQSRMIDSPSDRESVAQNTQLHICQHCSATFCSPYHLRRHEYTHTGERPYWCSECKMGFIQKYRYRNHRMTHHEERYLSIYKDQSRRRKKTTSSGENPAVCALQQQQLAESSESHHSLSTIQRKEHDVTNRGKETAQMLWSYSNTGVT